MPDKDAPTWTVISQTEDFGANTSGQYVPGVRVSFRVASGAVGSVFIPTAEYSVDRAREVIGATAMAMEAVSKLSG